MWARLGFDQSRPSRLVAISRLTRLHIGDSNIEHFDAGGARHPPHQKLPSGKSSPRTLFTGIERPVLGRNHAPHVGVSGGRIMGETWFAMSLALGNGCCGATIRRMLAASQCEMVTGPSFSSPNQPDQERTTAYRDSSGPNCGRMPIVLPLSAIGRSHLGKIPIQTRRNKYE